MMVIAETYKTPKHIIHESITFRLNGRFSFLMIKIGKSAKVRSVAALMAISSQLTGERLLGVERLASLTQREIT